MTTEQDVQTHSDIAKLLGPQLTPEQARTAYQVGPEAVVFALPTLGSDRRDLLSELSGADCSIAHHPNTPDVSRNERGLFSVPQIVFSIHDARLPLRRTVGPVGQFFS